MTMHASAPSYCSKWKIFIFCLLCVFLNIPSGFAFVQADLDRLLETRDCPNCDLSNADINDRDLRNANLQGANFKGARLFKVELEGANLQGADLSHTTIIMSSFKRGDLSNINLTHAKIRKTPFHRANLQGADLSFLEMSKGNLREADLQGAIARNAQFMGVESEETSAVDVDFTGAKFLGINFKHSNFTGARFKGAKFVIVDLDDTNFSHADLTDVYLIGGGFVHAVFLGANLQNAKLLGGHFDRVTFENADLRNAEIAGADILRSTFVNAQEEGISFHSLKTEECVWTDGSLGIPASLIMLQDDEFTKNWILHLIDTNSPELVTLVATYFPEHNMIIVPATLCLAFGLAMFLLFYRRRKSLLFSFGIFLMSVGLTLSLFTDLLYNFLQLGYLWEIFLCSFVCFTAGTICGYFDSLFGGISRKIIQILWFSQMGVTLLFVGLTIYLTIGTEQLFLPWFKLGFAAILTLFLICYLFIPIITIIRGVIQGTPDARIVSGTLTLAVVFSIPSAFTQEMWAMQIMYMGWLIFVSSPGLIIFRRSLFVQHQIENYASELKAKSNALQEKNQELSKLDKLKDEFLANTTHELKTPLNGMIGITESMLDGAAGDLTDDQKNNLSMIVTSSRRLTNLVNDILDFSKLKYKSIELQKKPIDLHTMCELILILSKPLLGDKSIKLVNDIPTDLPPVFSDENRLQQIFHNLVGNAIKFTTNGVVSVTAVQKDDWVEIMVQDTGIGIPKEKFDSIFQSFEQIDGSTSREYGGTGLGLTISRNLVELHGGTVWVESEENVGSRFFFTLPISDKPPATDIAIQSISQQQLVERQHPQNEVVDSSPLRVAEPANNDKRSFHILAVDDEPINLQVLVNHLTLNNYQVTKASNGQEAYELIHNQEFDLILLDVMMPKMTGYELCQKIREAIPPHQLPIILLTAKNQIAELVTGFNVGANDYLTKPISKNELLPRIQTHIQLSKISLAYSRFVPGAFLDLLNKENIIDVELGDHVQREMTILFADIRSFTALSETLTPEENFRFINSYLSQMEPIILENDGVIDKFIGDAIMALFDNPDKAVAAGIAMLDALDHYNQYRKNLGYLPIQIGIGINTGDLMLGTIGGEKRMDGTVISDAVNLASRMEGLTKYYKLPLLISEKTYETLDDKSAFNIRYVDHVRVKGKQNLVSIYEIYNHDAAPQRDAKKRIESAYQEALQFFQKEQWHDAANAFEHCLASLPDDTVLEMYLGRCQEAH